MLYIRGQNYSTVPIGRLLYVIQYLKNGSCDKVFLIVKYNLC